MKVILASGLVSQNGYNYEAHFCDDGLVYINWADHMGFQSSQVYFRHNGERDTEVRGTKGYAYKDAEKTLKSYVEGKLKTT